MDSSQIAFEIYHTYQENSIYDHHRHGAIERVPLWIHIAPYVFDPRVSIRPDFFKKGRIHGTQWEPIFMSTIEIVDFVAELVNTKRKLFKELPHLR